MGLDFANNAVTITGLQDTYTAIGGLGDRIQRRVLRKAVRQGAQIVRTEARQTAPVLTGRTKRKIAIKERKTKGRDARFQVLTGTREEMGIDPESKWYYPAIVEYGVAGRFEGRHYMRRSYEAKKMEARDAIIAELRAGIEREIRR